MTTFKTVSARGLDIFYREAGTPAHRKLLLLHGFPVLLASVSQPAPPLADRFHMVSFDYPGFGNSDMPDPAAWDYTFDHLADVIEGRLIRSVHRRMGFYMQDYGGPIGNRLIDSHPDWLAWQVIQNANTYEEGFTEAWDGLRHALWENRTPGDRSSAGGVLRTRHRALDLHHRPPGPS